MAALIGALRVSLSADTAQFEAGMKRAQATANSAASGISKSMGALKTGVMGLVAGLSVGVFLGAIKGALDFAGSLGETAQQLGVTAKELQNFRFVVQQNGGAMEDADKTLGKLSLSISKALAGSKQAAAAYSAVGVSLDDLRNKSKGDILGQIADGMKKTGGASANAAAGVAIFGKGFQKIVPTLDMGSAGITELARANAELGGVLSDEQIQNADKTADKLDQLQTVLKAQIAGAVADNSTSIIDFANSLVYLVGKIGDAVTWLQNLRQELSIAEQLYSIPAQIRRAAGVPAKTATQLGQVGSSVTLKLPPATPPKAKIPTGGAISDFLAGGGGRKSKKAAADHSAEDALRDQNQFDQELRRAHMDTLRAQQDLARDYIERTSISVEILNAEKAARDAEYAYQIALYKLAKGKQGQSEAQVAQLLSEEAITDSLAREKLLQDEQEQRQRDVQELSQHDYDRRRAVLESQAAIANTSAERRKIELELLRLAYEQKRQALQSIINTSKNIQEQEDARRDLANLNATYGNDQQAVMRGTRGPLEEWAASVPQTAAQINEAFQSIEANGLEGLTDAIASVVTGTESLKEAFGDLAKSIIADIIRMSIKMLIFRAISGFLGGGSSGVWDESGFGSIVASNNASLGIPGFASGGSMRILGRSGTDRNMLSLNGLPIARVSQGERINIANDNVNGGGLSRLVVELRDEMLEARIASGAQVQVVRAYPAFRAGATQAVGERRRRS